MFLWKRKKRETGRRNSYTSTNEMIENTMSDKPHHGLYQYGKPHTGPEEHYGLSGIQHYKPNDQDPNDKQYTPYSPNKSQTSYLNGKPHQQYTKDKPHLQYTKDKPHVQDNTCKSNLSR